MIMTHDKAFKSAIRARMAEAGEPYNVARRAVLSDSDDEAERGEAGVTSGPDASEARDEDYYARYRREAEEAGVPPEELQNMIVTERARDYAAAAREAAERAGKAAERAEQDADRAEERAGMAEEAAEMAQEWADPDEVERAVQRAGELQAQAEQARERAERARELAEQAEERAELTDEAADEAGADEDDGEDGPHWSWAGSGPHPPHAPHPPHPPHPPRGPSWSAQPTSGPERFLERLDEFRDRFEELRERADSVFDRMSRELGIHPGQPGKD